MENEFIYGAHYHRPPNPPADQHEFHLKKIKEELDFNLVKFRIQWNAIHVKPDTLNMDEVHRMFDICDRLGLNVIAEISHENTPYWLERKNPEARYVSANGQAIELGPYDSTQAGGYPGLCFHHDAVVKEAEKYLAMLISGLKDRRSLYCYDCWNEPHLEPAWIANYWGNMGDRLYCYCEESRDAFRSWLKEKYGTIEKVNQTWARYYGEWEDINPPNRHGTYADWMDWIRFWFDFLQGHMAWRYKNIKTADPSRLVVSHSGAVPPFIPRPNAFIHNWALAEPVDRWGTSFAPKYHNWSLAECAGTIDATRSAARGKEFWISEMSGGGVYKRGFDKTPIVREKDIRAWNWLSIAYGAKAIIYWCYLTESTGPEAGGFGLITYDGETTKRASEASRQKAVIQKYNSIIKNFSPQADIAVLYDPDNSSLLFAMENGDELYCHSQIGYYKALWENDLYVHYVTYGNLEDLQEKVLIIPMCLTLNQKAADKIKEYVNRGGIVIAEARMGLFDERGFLQPVLPSFGLAEVAGLTEGEAYCTGPENRPWLNNPDNAPWPEEIYAGPEIIFEYPGKASFRAHGYLSPLNLKGGREIGKIEIEDIVAASHNHFGEGEVYYLGTYLGLALYGRDEGAHALLSKIINKHITPKIQGKFLRPRLIEDKDSSLLAVFNDDKFEKYNESIKLPIGYKKAVNVFCGNEVHINNDRIEIEVDPEDVVLVCLEK